LRGAREHQGLTVVQAAEQLHVDARTLEALEAEDFAALGADVYVRGHLRRYAELIGESPAELQELYASSRQAARPDLTRIARRERGGGGARLVLPALLGLAGVALVVLLWWVLSTPGERPQPLAVAPPSATADAATGTTAAGAADEAAPAASAGATQLALKFAALSWAEVSDASGRRLLQGLYAPGSARTLSGAAPLRVILGNAPAVALRVNDQPVKLAGLVRHDGSARLLIDGDGRTTAAPPRLAHGD
ncbi:MAG TPA: helix-turn-helix domain-containing protein, partial [Steroidobacteraceae bacterium]|nr:helix-turn-helix domain-containing protein [Steroidobacteraceae bacterium]